MAKKEKEAEYKQVNQSVYSKRAVLNMPKYIRYYDLLSVILDGVSQYTLDDVAEKLSKFLNGMA